MKIVPYLRLLLLPFCLVQNGFAEDAPDPSLVSPDGRFPFEAYSSEEVDTGKKPSFGIVERATGKLVSDPAEALGDASRPEESILWAPDSLSYALTSRVGTRHLDTFLYRWDGKSFVRATWVGNARLESLAEEHIAKKVGELGYTDRAGRGRTIAGDSLPERWLDPRRLIMTRVEERFVSEGDKEDVVSGFSRAIVRWDENTSAYGIGRELPAAGFRVPDIEESAPFEITQTDRPGDDPNARNFTVRHLETGETKSLESENWMTSPYVKEEANGWPQLELVSHGPDEFIWHRLYRVVEGAYRCVQIDEMTRLAHQAPEGAPLVKIAPCYSLFLTRSRVPAVGDADTFESFQTESLSPDGLWKSVFTYTPQNLQRVEIIDTAAATDPFILYDFESGEGSFGTICETLWSPDSAAFAFFIKEGPRVGHTLLYRRLERVWSESPMPEIDYGFLKPTLDGGANWGNQFETPLWWNGTRELVLELSGFFRGENGLDYRALARLRWDEAGVPSGSETIPADFGGLP